MESEKKELQEVNKPEQLSTKKRVFIEAWIKSFGNVSQACRSAKIGRTTYYNWMNDDPVFKETLESEDIREQFKDFIEGQLLLKAQAKDTTMLIFLAKTQLKDRGYVERTEQEQIGGIKIEMTEEIVYPENGAGNNGEDNND